MTQACLSSSKSLRNGDGITVKSLRITVAPWSLATCSGKSTAVHWLDLHALASIECPGSRDLTSSPWPCQAEVKTFTHHQHWSNLNAWLVWRTWIVWWLVWSISSWCTISQEARMTAVLLLQWQCWLLRRKLWDGVCRSLLSSTWWRIFTPDSP